MLTVSFLILLWFIEFHWIIQLRLCLNGYFQILESSLFQASGIGYANCNLSRVIVVY